MRVSNKDKSPTDSRKGIRFLKMIFDLQTTKTALFQFKTADGQAPTMEEFKKKFAIADHGVDDSYGFAQHKDAKGNVTYFALMAEWAITPELKKHADCVGAWRNDNEEAFDLPNASLKRLWSIGEMTHIFNTYTRKFIEEMCEILEKHGENIVNQRVDIDEETDFPCIVLEMHGNVKNVPDTQLGEMKVRFVF